MLLLKVVDHVLDDGVEDSATVYESDHSVLNMADSDEAIEAVDVQEGVEPIDDPATETVEDAVDLMAGESSEETDALEDEVSAPTDDVGIGEEVSASVSAPVGDVEDSDEAVEGVDVQEAAEPKVRLTRLLSQPPRLSKMLLWLMAGESSEGPARP